MGAPEGPVNSRQTNKSKQSFSIVYALKHLSVIKLASTFFAYFNFLDLLAIDTYLKQTSQNGRSIIGISIREMQGPVDFCLF